eukprot:m.29255 g.29255  ORF g.29255 m.29255 type:complete len:70 (+) comp31152_c0_seq4:190-399(+)
MICTLAMFLSPSEKLKSRSAVSEKEFKYESDLFLQGLIVERGHFGYEKIPEVECSKLINCTSTWSCAKT